MTIDSQITNTGHGHVYGLSGAGKTSLAQEVLKIYRKRGIKTILLDGDLIRKGINNDLSFSKEDRKENVRRIAEICKLMLEVDVVPFVAAITPYEAHRELVKKIIGQHRILMVYIECPITECEKRDPKGLYRLARKGKIESFTGISDTFEEPEPSTISINTANLTLEQSVQKLYNNISTLANGK